MARAGSHMEFDKELLAVRKCYAAQRAGYVRATIIGIGHAAQFALSRGLPASLVDSIDLGARAVIMMDDAGQLQHPGAAAPELVASALARMHENLDGWCDVAPAVGPGGVLCDYGGLRQRMISDKNGPQARAAAAAALCRAYDVTDTGAALSAAPLHLRQNLVGLISS